MSESATTQLALDFALPAARRSDPASSHAVADWLEGTGRAARQRQEVARALFLFPGRTSRDLAEDAGLDRYVTARRLPELEEHGYAIVPGSIGTHDRSHIRGPLRWFPTRKLEAWVARCSS